MHKGTISVCKHVILTTLSLRWQGKIVQIYSICKMWCCFFSQFHGWTNSKPTCLPLRVSWGPVLWLANNTCSYSEPLCQRTRKREEGFFFLLIPWGLQHLKKKLWKDFITFLYIFILNIFICKIIMPVIRYYSILNGLDNSIKIKNLRIEIYCTQNKGQTLGHALGKHHKREKSVFFEK